MKVFVVGDSISMQYGPYLEAYLKGFMDYERKAGEDEAQLDLDNPQGANGGDSRRVLRYLRAAIPAGQIRADFMLLNCGLHDIKRDPTTRDLAVPLSEYTDNLQAIIDLIGGSAMQLVWIRTTPVDEAVHNTHNRTFHRFAADCEAFNLAADSVMQAAGVPCIDLHRFTLNLGDEVFCDHVHFTDPVRQQQAAFIAGWLAGRPDLSA